MKKMLLAVAVLLVGCAKPPEDITATPVSTAAYLMNDCPQLAIASQLKSGELAELDIKQREAAEEDKNAMYAIHVPVGSLRGKDQSRELALVKGQIQAIDAAKREKGCG